MFSTARYEVRLLADAGAFGSDLYLKNLIQSKFTLDSETLANIGQTGFYSQGFLDMFLIDGIFIWKKALNISGLPRFCLQYMQWSIGVQKKLPNC